MSVYFYIFLLIHNFGTKDVESEVLGLIVTGSNCTRRAVFAGGKQACKSEKGGSTHTSTCSYFARGLLFRNGAAVSAAEAAAISWRYFFLFSSPIFARLRERESEKNAETNENEHCHPFSIPLTRILWQLS